MGDEALQAATAAPHPADDGLWLMDTRSGASRLLVSLRQLFDVTFLGAAARQWYGRRRARVQHVCNRCLSCCVSAALNDVAKRLQNWCHACVPTKGGTAILNARLTPPIARAVCRQILVAAGRRHGAALWHDSAAGRQGRGAVSGLDRVGSVQPGGRCGRVPVQGGPLHLWQRCSGAAAHLRVHCRRRWGQSVAVCMSERISGPVCPASCS